MNKVIKNTVKVALTAAALAAALTGCHMFGARKGCNCSCNGANCSCHCADAGRCEKSRGANASMTLGVGTDGVHAGGDANLGNHGVSAGAGGTMH